jgi:hypothetical protein
MDRDWEVSYLNPRPFDLAELADYIELETKPKNEKIEVSGLGRNCAMFDTVRFWAYKAIRAHLAVGFEKWHLEVLGQAKNANGAFLEPLPYSEVKATAKSVARWVWRNHNSAEFQQAFSEKQSQRAKIGVSNGNVSLGGKARSAQYSDMRQEALKMQIAGKSIKEISTLLNVHRNTVSNWLKDYQKSN